MIVIFKMKNQELYSLVYVVLAFILVSLTQTYTVTAKLASFVKIPTTSWGPGMDIKSNTGFWVHIVVFILLLLVPMFLVK